MYQRKKVRDLFDMEYALTHGTIDVDRVLQCWRRYMTADGHQSPTHREFVENMEQKMSSADYLNDMVDILRPDVSFDPHAAYAHVREYLIDKIVDSA